jgi:serine/threonine protein kinase
MELVRGQGLRLLIGQPIDVEKFQTLARQMAEALSVAHGAGLVHRDVKPENIMVRDDGYVKVLDFGLARLDPAARQAVATQTATATGTQSLVGTVRYMSPEQTKAGAVVGTPSDVFSLGIVLYELATGQHPFEADSQYGVLHAIVAHQPVPPSRLNVELSGKLETLLLRMLDKNPALRPTAADVALARSWRHHRRAPASFGHHSQSHPAVIRWDA